MASKGVMKRPVLKVPQDLEEAADFIRQIGEAQREINGIEDHLNRIVAELQERAMDRSRPYTEQIELLRDGLYAFTEAHRDELTEGGKRKTVELPTGVIAWRSTPPAVSLRNIKAVLAELKRRRLQRFIRVKKEVNKEAMLREPELAGSVKGVTIGQREEFVVKPAELEVEIASDTAKLKKAIA